MIISRTPFRISFFGGGTDYPVWYKENEGAVISASINKFCYITCRYLPPFFNYKYRIVYSSREEVEAITDINHPSVRECLKFMGLNRGIEIHYDGDLPSRTGLGSSSSFTVGLLNCLYALQGKMISKKQLALNAIKVEQELIHKAVGSQDQVVAAFGGFNRIRFFNNQNIEVQPLIVGADKLRDLQNHLMLFFTGFSRTASEIAQEQIESTAQKQRELISIYAMVERSLQILTSDENLDEFGKLLHESWLIKRSLTSKISTSAIDEIYARGLSAGAIGGKLMGSGGGGFILFFAHPCVQPKIKKALRGLLYVPFKFETLGSQIIYYGPNHDIDLEIEERGLV